MDISPAPLDIAASAGRLVALPRWLPCFLCGAGDWTRHRPRSTGARASSPWTLLRAGPVSLSKPQRQMGISRCLRSRIAGSVPTVQLVAAAECIFYVRELLSKELCRESVGRQIHRLIIRLLRYPRSAPRIDL